MLRLRSLLLVLLASTASLPSASAQPAPTEEVLNKARAQFQQALAREAAEDWAGALGLLQAVSKVKLTPQVRYHIALCQDHLGKLLDALADYQIALGEAKGSDATVVAEATEKLEKLRPRIPRVTLRRGDGAEAAAVSIDGISLGASQIGVEIQLDPGPHTIQAKAPERQPFSSVVTLGEGEKKEVTLLLAREVDPSARPAASGPAQAAEPSRKRSWVPYAVGGAGVVSLAASGVFFLMRSTAIKQLDTVCGPDRNDCPAASESTYSRGQTYTALAGSTLALGLIGVGVGGYLLFSDRPAAAGAASLRITPAAPAAQAGVSLAGRF